MSGQSNPTGGSQEPARRQEAGLPFQELTSGWKQPESVNDIQIKITLKFTFTQNQINLKLNPVVLLLWGF